MSWREHYYQKDLMMTISPMVRKCVTVIVAIDGCG